MPSVLIAEAVPSVWITKANRLEASWARRLNEIGPLLRKATGLG